MCGYLPSVNKTSVEQNKSVAAGGRWCSIAAAKLELRSVNDIAPVTQVRQDIYNARCALNDRRKQVGSEDYAYLIALMPYKPITSFAKLAYYMIYGVNKFFLYELDRYITACCYPVEPADMEL